MRDAVQVAVLIIRKGTVRRRRILSRRCVAVAPTGSRTFSLPPDGNPRPARPSPPPPGHGAWFRPRHCASLGLRQGPRYAEPHSVRLVSRATASSRPGHAAARVTVSPCARPSDSPSHGPRRVCPFRSLQRAFCTQGRPAPARGPALRPSGPTPGFLRHHRAVLGLGAVPGPASRARGSRLPTSSPTLVFFPSVMFLFACLAEPPQSE